MLLLRSMGQSVLISQTQMTMGFTRMMEAVEDLSLDVPAAGERFAELVAEAKSHKVLEEDFGNTPAHADVVRDLLCDIGCCLCTELCYALGYCARGIGTQLWRPHGSSGQVFDCRILLPVGISCVGGVGTRTYGS